MARPKKPLESQTRHNTKAEIQRRKEAEAYVAHGKEQLKNPPSWMKDKEARKEWKRVYALVKDMNMIGNLDRNNMIAYCEAYSKYTKVTRDLENQDILIMGEANPLIDVQKKYYDQMAKAERLMGISIDGRIKVGQMMVEKEESEIEDLFGI